VSTTYKTISYITLQCPPDLTIHTRKLKLNIVILHPKNSHGMIFEKENLLKWREEMQSPVAKGAWQELLIDEIMNEKIMILKPDSTKSLVEESKHVSSIMKFWNITP